MNEPGSASHTDLEVESTAPQGVSIRRAIHELGSKDHETRVIARATVLSAGEHAPAALLHELERDRKRIKAGAYRVVFVVASILVFGPLASARFDAGWILTVANVSACLLLLVASMLATRSTWHREAARLLSRYHSPETTRAMIHSLTDVWGEDQPLLREAIIQRLGRVRPADASWLKDQTRDRVIALLSMPNWSSPTCVEDFLTMARALATVGATEAIPVLKGANCASLDGEKRDLLRAGLDDVVRELEAVATGRKPGDDARSAAHAVIATRDGPASGGREDEARPRKIGHGP